MLKYGYERKGRSDSYRSPMQSSGSFATKDFGTHWVSLSGSDRASGIGQASGEFCYGDAFDIWAHFEHGGRMSDAVREYGKEIRPTPAKQREEIVKAASDPYSDFDMVPDQEPEPVQPKATIIIPNAEQKPIFWLKDAEPVLTSSYLIKGWLGRGQMSVVYGP